MYILYVQYNCMSFRLNLMHISIHNENLEIEIRRIYHMNLWIRIIFPCI